MMDKKRRKIIWVVVMIFLFLPINALSNDAEKTSINLKNVPEEKDSFNTFTPSQAYLQENLAPNPSFEYRNGILPDGWEHTNSRYAKFLWDGAYAHTGERSIGITDIKAAHTCPNWHNIEPIPIDPINNTYALGVWYKYYTPPSQYSGGYISITGLDKNGHQVGFTWMLYLPYVDNEWHYFQYICNPYFNQSKLEEIKYARLNLCYYTWREVNSSEGIRFDDVFFGEGEFPVIEIGDIRGFFGTISITVRNAGNVDAENIPWEIRVIPAIGEIFTGENTGGVIDKLPAGAETKIKSNFIFGFGGANVFITVGEKYEILGYTIVGPLLIKMS